MKRKLIVSYLFLFSLLFSFNVSALTSTSADLTNRNNCNIIELGIANPDGTMTSIGCYDDYSSAKTAMNNSSEENAIIIEKVSNKFKVIDAKYALVYLDKGNVNNNIYTSSSVSSVYTYMNNYSAWGATDGAFLELNYSNKAIKIKISGLTGWIKNDTYTIIPLSWTKSSSYYYIDNTNIYHYYAKNIESTYTQYGRALGPKIDNIDINRRYYSYDGIYLYKDQKLMLDDYKKGIYSNSANVDAPYYNYYMYLPHRSKTTYTLDDFDAYIRNVLNFKGSIYGNLSVSGYSALYGMGDFYLNAEKLYGANALSVFSLSRNESANGTSEIARDKNNIFGHGAVDGSPYNSSTGYLDVASSIYSHAFGYINYGYSEVSDSRYYGTHFGNKYKGMNVKYASDPYWGEKAANYYYTFDKDNGLSDYNYYQLGILKDSHINARTEPNTSSNIPYVYTDASAPLVILDEVNGTSVNGSTLWYKVQADSNLNSTRTAVVPYSSNWPEYNWNSYVYVHSSYVTKINNAKKSDGTYNQPNNVRNEPTASYTYKAYANSLKYTPSIGILTADTPYYYSSSLINKKGTALKNSYVSIIEEAKNGDSVNYLIITDYLLNQKHWISGENVKIVPCDYAYVSTYAGNKVDIYDNILGKDIGNSYTGNFLPIIDYDNTNEDVWLKVQTSINPISYNYINGTYVWYTLDYTHIEPIITANDKVLYLDSEYNLLDFVTAEDKQDGDISKSVVVQKDNINIKVAGTYSVTYSVKNSRGISASKTINVTVNPYQSGESLFMYHNLEHKENNKFQFSGFLSIKGMNNTNVLHTLVFVNQLTNKEYTYSLDNWREYPYEMSSLDDKIKYDYSGGWFNSIVDLTSLPSGDYTIYVRARNGEYETKAIFTNVAYQNMTRRANNANRGYAVEIDFTSSGSPLLFSVRDNSLISSDIPKTVDPMYNFFSSFNMVNNNLSIKGTSHNVGIDLSKNKVVSRYIIFENTETFERYTYDIGSIINGDYNITLAVSDNCDKTRAWYNKTIDISNLGNGTYAIYIKNSVDGISYYGELIDIAYTNLDKVNGNGYTFKRINNRRLRLELTINK